MNKTGTCDICDTNDVVVSQRETYGIETHMCMLCDQTNEISWIEEEIERVLPKAESGEQWAYICALEARIVELRQTTGIRK